MTNDQAAFLKLLQITDSSFPTGGFAFSHGLESLSSMGDVRNAQDVRDFSQTQIEESLARLELPAAAFAYRSAADGDIVFLSELDERLDLLKSVPVFRQASRKLGRRLLQSAAPIVIRSIAGDYLAAIEDKRMNGHHSIAFGVITHGIGVDENTALLALASSSLNGYVAAAVRLGAIGQRAAQAIVSELQPALIGAVEHAQTLDIDDLGAYAPMIDLAGLFHASRSARQFTS